MATDSGCAAALYETNWFYPAFMVIIGAHYLPFSHLYGMRLFIPSEQECGSRPDHRALVSGLVRRRGRSHRHCVAYGRAVGSDCIQERVWLEPAGCLIRHGRSWSSPSRASGQVLDPGQLHGLVPQAAADFLVECLGLKTNLHRFAAHLTPAVGAEVVVGLHVRVGGGSQRG